MKLEQITYCYFLGIGGIGMSALARYFKAMGKQVSGYDKTSTPLTQSLEAEGIAVHYDENTGKIPAEIRDASSFENILIVWTPAIPADHAELVFFRDKNFPLKKRAEVLGLITADTYTIAIAGTHGKTTTSTLTAHILRTAGIDCSAFLGGIAQNYNTNLLLGEKLAEQSARYDASNIVVAEADEYDRSFLWLRPAVAVITSVDADHLDIYGDESKVIESYSEFAKCVRENGFIITKPEVKNKLGLSGENVITYSVDDTTAQYHAKNISIADGSFSFDLVTPGGIISGIKIGTPGRHNIENAIAAAAAAQRVNAGDDALRSAIASFRGARRRFDYRVKNDRCIYIDDYAHHPEELKAVISAARQLYPNRRITGIFQPHLFSRTRDFADQFARSLELLDELLLLEIYPAREKPIPGITSSVLLEKISLGKKMLVQKNELLDRVSETSPEVLLTMGAGDIDTFVEPLEKMLGAQTGKEGGK